MLQRLVEKLQELAQARPRFDPAQFDDPLAVQVEWTPVRSGGANFRTHNLAMVHSDRIEFQAALGAKLFYGIFIFVGVMAPAGVFAAFYLSGESMVEGPVALVIPVLIGLTFLAVGGGMMYLGTAPIVFDKHRGYFWRGRKAPYDVVNVNELKNACRLGDIHALQLLSEHCRGNKSSYYSYELNLVLNDGTRLNVVDHGNKEKIRADTAKLSEFLNCPVWDSI